MTKGTDPTPIQLTPKFSLDGSDNYIRLMGQLLEANADWKVRDKFTEELLRLKHEQKTRGESGQIDIINSAAEAIGAEIHWVD